MEGGRGQPYLDVECVSQLRCKFDSSALLPETYKEELRMLSSDMIADT
jgi:hypothetical protein